MKRNISLVVLLSLIVIGVFSVLNRKASAAGGQAPPLRTNGILTGFCYGGIAPGGAYLNGLGGQSFPNIGCAPDPTQIPLFVPMPSKAGLRHLTATQGGCSDCGGGVVTLTVNGNPTALSCTLPVNTAPPYTSSCRDTTDLVLVHAGDQIGVFVTAGNDVVVAMDRTGE